MSNRKSNSNNASIFLIWSRTNIILLKGYYTEGERSEVKKCDSEDKIIGSYIDRNTNAAEAHCVKNNILSEFLKNVK